MKNCLTLSIFALLLSGASVIQASDAEPGSGANPYTECGIGGAIFQTVPWAAATSNVIWDLGITAITSATLSPQTCNAKTVAMVQYIQGSYASLELDVIGGRGAYLDGLISLSGCAYSHLNLFVDTLRLGMLKSYEQEAFASLNDRAKGAELFNSTVLASAACDA